MAGNYSIFYISQEPLYTKEELLAINDTIQNSNMKQSEPEKFGADGANKKSKVSCVPWIELKSCLKKFEKFIFDANNDFFNYDIIHFQSCRSNRRVRRKPCQNISSCQSQHFR